MTHWQMDEVWTTAGKFCLPEATMIDDLSHAIQAWRNLEQTRRERTGDQVSKDMRLAILVSTCPTDLKS